MLNPGEKLAALFDDERAIGVGALALQDEFVVVHGEAREFISVGFGFERDGENVGGGEEADNDWGRDAEDTPFGHQEEKRGQDNRGCVDGVEWRPGEADECGWDPCKGGEREQGELEAGGLHVDGPETSMVPDPLDAAPVGAAPIVCG